MTAAQQRRALVVEADGGSRGNPGPAGYGALVRDAATGAVLAERADFLGVVSNNVAEYSGLVAGLRAAAEIDPAAQVEVRMDSKLVVEQMSGRWKIKHEDMARLAAEAAGVLPRSQVTYTWVPRASNGAADGLANEAMDTRAAVVRDHDAGRLAESGAAPARSGGTAASAPAPTPDALPRVALGARMAVRIERGAPLSVLLLRHGETPMTPLGQYSGSDVAGPPLSASGRVQAAQAADLLARVGHDVWPDVPPPRRVVASPIVRARETAEAVGRRLGCHVEEDARLAEVRFGAWEGLTRDEIESGWPGDLQRFYDEPARRAPGGESIDDVGRRVRAALDELVAHHGTSAASVALVTHSVTIRAAVGIAFGADAASWSRLRVGPGSITLLNLWPDGATEVVAVGVPPAR